jgi:glutamate-1-semialdehyde 2,1-aminomutase
MKIEEKYKKSREMIRRVERVIPLASQTFSKSHIQYPQAAPHFLSHGRGSRVWDVDGNEYIDFINGLLPIILGYKDPDVDAAVLAQMEKGVLFSLASPLEGELAELLVETIPCAEMVRFGKNGSDATTGAVRIARAYTGRDRVAVCGYHGWQDWYIGSTSRNKGIPSCVQQLTHTFSYNDLFSLQRLFDEHHGEFAAVIMEPMNIEEPKPGFLEGVRKIAHENGALFIMDEIITGFRYAVGGAQEYFDVVPDLAAFGKSMANGYPISAVVGKREIMKEMEDVFFSFTFGGEALSLAAALATLRKIREERVVDRLWETGSRIAEQVGERLRTHGLDRTIGIKGKPPWTLLMFQDHEAATSWEIKSLFIQEMLARGILITAGHNVSFSHSNEDVDALLACYDEVLSLVRHSLEERSVATRLIGDPIQPLFQVR